MFVVPLDGSEDAAVALPVAGRLAAAVGADIELLSAVGHDSEVAERRDALDRLVHDGLKLERTVVVESDPATAIGRAADRPGHQVCMATRGRGRTASVLGSVALGVLGTLERPVMCVGARLGRLTTAAPSVGVLVCLDGSPHSEAALEPATRWAGLLGEPLTLATAVEDAPPSASGGPPRRRFGVDDPDAYLAAHAQRLRGRVASVDTRVLVDPLDAVGALRSQMTGEATAMVVAATRGRSGVARVVLGSVAAVIVQCSGAPVLLVPAPS